MTAAAILQLILNLLGAVEELTPELETVIPIAQKIVGGSEVTTPDLQALQAVQATLDAQVAASAASIEGAVT